jgi:hypothetical protein
MHMLVTIIYNMYKAHVSPGWEQQIMLFLNNVFWFWSYLQYMYKFGTDGRDNTVSKFICYCVCIRCRGNMFTEPLSIYSQFNNKT